MYQTLRSKVNFKSNTVDAIRNLPKNESILLHDLETGQDTLFSILKKKKSWNIPSEKHSGRYY